MDTDPIAVALKFGFLAVLYLFLFWVARSACKELRRPRRRRPRRPGSTRSAPAGAQPATDAWLVVATGGGLDAGERFDLFGGISIGRSSDADVRIEDRFASGVHARVYSRGASYYVEDMNSTNGTFLNGGQPEGRGRAQRPRRGPDRRHRVPLRARRSRRLTATCHAEGRRTGIPDRHRAAAGRERGLVLRRLAGLRGRRRDGRRAGRRGGVAAGGRVVRARSQRGDESPEAYLRAIAKTRQRAHPPAWPRPTPRGPGMGTTLTAALVEGDEVGFAHVGDSRAYLFRDGELKLLTSDHSLVEELRRQGRLTDEQAEDHPQRSIITRALGPEREVEVDTMTYRARARRRLPAVLGRPDDDAQGRPDRRGARRVGRRSRRRVERLIAARPTRRAAATTSPSSPSASRRPRRRAADEERRRWSARGRGGRAHGRGRRGGRGAAARRATREPAAVGGAAAAAPGAALAASARAKVLAVVVVTGVCGGWPYGARGRSTSSGTDSGGRWRSTAASRTTFRFGINLYSEVYASPVQVELDPAEPAATARPTTPCASTATPPRCSTTSRRAAERRSNKQLAQTEQRAGGKPAAAAGRSSGGGRRGGQAAAAAAAEAAADSGRRREAPEARAAGRMSARNRELLALIPVALLVTAGFTAVFIVDSNQIGDLSLIYGGYFLAVCVGVHLFIRLRLPVRRPLPVPALRAARGHRAGDALPDRRRPGLRSRRRSSSPGPIAARADDHLPARLPRRSSATAT